MDKNLQKKLEETQQFIRRKTKIAPRIGLILGSGLGDLAESSSEDVAFPYRTVPHFVRSTVEGHAGMLFAGFLYGKPSIVMQGRFHFYEGYSMDEITYPVHLMKAMGVEYLIVTAAAGGLNPRHRPGDIVFIDDHINMMGHNPLRGPTFAAHGERFPDMRQVYRRELLELGLEAARRHRIRASQGVYMAVQGPSYETPAEVRAFRSFGADMVGMSVVPETIVAHQLGMKILGITYISNLAAGVLKRPLTHEEVLATGKTIALKLDRIIEHVVGGMPTVKK